ncbi:MAG TPA: hypothetical protein VGY56_19345 [Verrucomicrobiae bacterium]|nr:hypothetical protein [Verrucomicrobiae bacterium]
MQTKMTLAGGIAAVILATTAVQAVEITGNIGFMGFSGTSVSGSVTTFSPVNPWLDVGGTGDYGLTGGALATFNSISYTGTGGGATLTAPVDPLWTFNISGFTYSFDLTSLLNANVTANSVSLSGLGTAYITGYDPTEASWSLKGAGANEQFEINFGTTSTGTGPGGTGGSPVPDGGATVGMLGLALGVCGLFARKFQPA